MSSSIETSHVERLLADMVRIPSVNPRVRGGRPEDNEGELADYVASRLRKVGVDIELQEVQPGRRNVVAHVLSSPGADQETLLLSAHMDTYPVPDDEREHLGTVRGHEMFGRGSADAKGSLAAMILAAESAVKAPRRREVYLVASVDEEFGLDGARTVVSAGRRASLAITGEPTQLQPIIAQKGVVRFGLHIAGNVAHAAYPGDGNAVARLGRCLVEVQNFCALLRGERVDDELGFATLTATRVSCDGDMNKTPSVCHVAFDARILPDDGPEAFVERLRVYLGGVLDFAVEMEPIEFVSPANRCPRDSKIVNAMFDAVRSVTGKCEPAGFSYGSEAGVLAQVASAAMVFGPGNPKYSHGPGERVDLREVAAASRVFETLMTR